MFCLCCFLLKRSCLQTHVISFWPTAAGDSRIFAHILHSPRACLVLLTHPSSDRSCIFMFTFNVFISVSISSIHLEASEVVFSSSFFWRYCFTWPLTVVELTVFLLGCHWRRLTAEVDELVCENVHVSVSDKGATRGFVREQS